MKRKHSEYILAVLALSVCSHIVHIVSETTENWVVAEAVPSEGGGNETYINYGLFQGTMEKTSGNVTQRNWALKLTCLLYLNVCAWTCQVYDYLRQEEIVNLYNKGEVLYPCSSSNQHFLRLPALPLPSVRERFINGVVWLATVAAIVLSGVTSLVALILTGYNINHIPSNYWISIRGLYFWFGTSCIFSILVLGIWGLEFLFKLSENVGTVDTIAGLLNSNGKAYLGYSYWCQLLVVALHCCCVALLYYRQTLFDQRPPFVGSLQRQNNTLTLTSTL